VLTGQHLPADVAAQLAASPLPRLYDPARVDALSAAATASVSPISGDTDLAFAFVPA